MDKYGIDSHKLMYHVQRVHNWMDGKIIYPIYMEVSPSGACNHRCLYCGLDFMEYKPQYLKTDVLKERLSELGKLGLKSIMYAGEGEPFLHRDMAEIIEHTNKSNIDVGITTNGVLLNKKVVDSTLEFTNWIKVSINGATRNTYSKIHRTKPEDFDKVIENMSYAAKVKRDNGYFCTLGMQLVLLPENSHEVLKLAALSKDIGMDYLVIKPYSQHPQSKTTEYSAIQYGDYEYLGNELKKFNTADFNVIFRLRAMEKWDDGGRNYRRCLALPFWSYIDAGGNVWGCSVYLRDERFLYGNIYEQTFQEIWNGEKRMQSLREVSEKLDTSQCRVNCRMDEINRYLWKLKFPPEHVNFI
ncbi:radical SAM protein [bacterium]|nr:radical SAM protein [bacterium]MBU3956605.1 radical SAM protein [bacterium]MBU4133840.1 radical SAM protein [bacterium]